MSRLYCPCLARTQQIVHAADLRRSLYLLDLLGNLHVVDIVVGHVADDADGDGVVGILHGRKHRVERGVGRVGVVREHVVDGISVLADGYDLQAHVLEYETLALVGTEEHLLTVAQRDGALGARSLVTCKVGVGLVVEDDAVDQSLYDGHTFVFGRSNKAILRQRDLHVDGAGEEGSLGAYDQLARVEGLLDRAVGRGLGDLAQLRGGGVLPLGQAVDLVVEENDVQVDVAADGVDEVVAADGQRVAVTGRHPDREARVGHLDARCHGVGAAVDRVEAEGLHVVDEARRAADARYEREEVVGRVGAVGNLGQCALHGVQNGVVAAAGAPAYLLVAFEIRRGVFEVCHGVISIRIQICREARPP